MDGGTFYGVPDDALRAIGCVIVAGARLEWVIRIIAADLYVVPGNSQASVLLKEVRRTASEGLPPHARTTTTEVLEWTRRAMSALNERHEPSHSSAAVRMADGPVLIHLRSGNVTPVDAKKLMASARRISAVEAQGVVLFQSLRHSPRLGVFLPNVVLDGDWSPLCSTDVGGPNLIRPTAAELDQWWRQLGPFPSL